MSTVRDDDEGLGQELTSLLQGLRAAGELPAAPALPQELVATGPSGSSLISGDGLGSSPVPPNKDPPSEPPLPDSLQLLTSLRGRGDVPPAPTLPELDEIVEDGPRGELIELPRRGWMWGGMALVASALLAVWALPAGLNGLDVGGRAGVGVRGDSVTNPVSLDLRMVVERGGMTVRLGDGVAARVGERIYFRVRSTPASELRLSVAGPEGEAMITLVEANPEGVDVHSGEGLLAYAFDKSGTYTFTLDEPRSEASHQLSVEVR